MNRSPKNPIDHRQLSSRSDNNKTLSELVMKTPNSIRSRQSPTMKLDQSDDSHDNDSDDDQVTSNQTLSKFIRNQPTNPSRTRSPSAVSLKSVVIDGQWKYRGDGDDNDKLRLQSKGIENLITICHDIMQTTSQSIREKKENRKKPSSSSSAPIDSLFPIVKLDAYKQITNPERASLQRAKVYNLMTIVYEAASTSASISQLVRIWREATEHNLNPSRRKKPVALPKLSYEIAFQHLIRKPDNQLLQIGLHASLISSGNGINLRHLGKNLGVDRRQFDIESIRNSLEDFQKLIQYLRKQKLKEKHEQKHIDTKKLTYEPKERQGIYVNLAGARLNLVVRKAIETSGFDVSPDTDFTCNLLWTDTLISMDIVSALKPYQKVNHFPQMNEIARKDLLVKNYTKLANLFPKEYNFIPKTWILPEEYNSWYSYASTKPKKDPMSYILKPFDASMGQGIAIHYDHKQIRPLDNYIIQEYIREPYLIDGFKFDVRIYVLITSCDPLRVFIYKNGIIQMCSKQYDLPTPTNVLDLSMHLTNYSIDDENNLDIENGKKQPLKFLFKYLKKQEQDDAKLWREIENIVLKTIFLAEPSLLTAYRTCRPGSVPISGSVCFEILGFDILIDKNLKPWLIEVNHCPNFDADEQLEYNIKTKLLFDTFHLLNFQRSDRKKSLTLEKLEEQQQLYVNLGRQINKQKRELDELKENLYLLRREKGREQFENDHLGDYVRLLPINDQRRMDELIDLLTKSFEILPTNKTDTTWTMKYFHRVNERDLLNKISQLEKPAETDQQTNAKLTYTSKKHLGNNRELSSIGHSFETSDDEKRARSQSPRSERVKKISLTNI